MPLISLSMDKIKRNFRENPHNRWGKGEDRPAAGNSADASFRIHRSTLPMWLRESGLSIDGGSALFAMGSCFAREVEAAFFRRGFNVLSRPSLELLPSGRPEFGTLNRYNTPSMLLEFQRLLTNPNAVPDDALLIEERPGIYSEAHYHSASTGTLDEVLDRRRKFLSVFQNIRSADLIVLTLGLNEAAFEVRSGLYRNVSPTVKEVRRGTELEVHMLSVRENVEYLEEIRSLIRKHCHKSPPLVVTVSPVPLQFTYLFEDIVSANGAGKATLRAAANEFCASYPDVHYFPSYEIALNSAQESVFRSDKVHIKNEFVDHIIGQFVSRYVVGEQESEDEIPPARADSAPDLSI